METGNGTPDAEWFRGVVDGSDLVFFVLRVQPDVAYEFMSPGIEKQLGVRAEDAIADAQAVLRLLDPRHAGEVPVILGLRPGSETTIELRWRHVDGCPVYTRTWLRSRQRANGSVVLDGATQDIARLHEAEADLRQSEERYRLLAENAWDVIWTMALDGSITYVSPAIERVRGITPEAAMHQSLEEIHPPDSRARVEDYFGRLFAAIADGTPPPTFHGELEYYRTDGSVMLGEVQVIPQLDADGRVVQILGVTRDISDRRLFETELARLAATDPLTGVWNRRHGQELVTAVAAHARRHAGPVSLLMLDIDRFKAVNDTYGHLAGDQVLAEIARRLLENLRSTDMVARWGGEEFVILLRDCALEQALAIAEKIRSRIADSPFDDVSAVSVSVGVAERRQDDDLTSWLARADSALYKAKRAGRNAVRSIG